MTSFSTRRLRRIALVAIGGLLLNAATVHVANAAALLRGVPTGEICDVWGVRMPDAPVPHGDAMHHAMHDADMAMPAGGHDMAAMAMPDDDASMAMAMDDEASDASMPTAEAPPAPAHDHSHAHHHHDACEHCALAGLTTFASSMPTIAVPCAPAHAHVALRTSTSDVALFDAVESWRLHLKRGPPRRA